MCIVPASGNVRDALFSFILLKSSTTASSSSLSRPANNDEGAPPLGVTTPAPPTAAAATTVAALPFDVVVVLLLLSDVNDEFMRISSNSFPNNSFSVNSPRHFVSPKGLKVATLLLLAEAEEEEALLPRPRE